VQGDVNLISENDSQIINNSLKQPEEIKLIKHRNRTSLIFKQHVNDYSKLVNLLNVIRAGTEIGEIKSGQLIPLHELALSFLLQNNIPSFDANMDTALNYLRKNNIAIDDDLTGWKLLKYLNLNLGWVKVNKDRINNYYPSEWRIRM
jgi:NOL1/NOP2/fmu family ribosome biogenesis protein